MESEIKPLYSDEFNCSTGRGPELVKIHWMNAGKTLTAVDFLNPDDKTDHLLFTRVQVFMFTPEEVVNYITLDPRKIAFRPAAIFNLGKSAWFTSFYPHHLGKCDHYQIMFYDQLLDIICERVELCKGGYLAY
jgi:hypothetical protein